MLTIIGQDIISGNMGYIGTEPGRLYRMGPQSKVAEASGEPPMVLADCKKKPLKGLRIYGKSKQVTTTGAQLFPPPMLGSQEKNGITIDCMEDGKIRIRGTAEILTDFYVSRLQLSAGTYTFSAGVNIDASTLRYALVTPGGVPYYDVNGDYTTDTIAETIDVSLLLRVYAGKTIDLTVQPMLNASSATLPWEPYTGGKPSPSPDYPQEIESVGQDGEIGVEVYGRNLFNARTAINGKVVDKHTGSMLSNSRYACSDYIAIPCNAVSLYQNGGTKNQRAFYDSDKNFIAVEVSVNPVTVPKNAKYIRITSEIDKQDMNNIMLSISSTALPYENYHEPQYMNISTPNGLPGIPVSSGGNYIDADGRQWICDEIDLARGVYVQRVAFTTVDGNAIKFKERGEFWNLPDGSAPGCGDQNTAINNFFSKNMFGANGRFDFIYALSANMEKYFKIKTPDELNEFCKNKYDAGTPLTLYYALATPIETPLTPDKIAAYKALNTYKGTTIIDNDAGAYMSVKYNT